MRFELEGNEIKHQPPIRVSVEQDSNDVNIRIGGILVAYLNGCDGSLQRVWCTVRERKSLTAFGIKFDKDDCIATNYD